MSIQQRAAVRLVKDADLSLLGVPAGEQPTASRYPKKFSRDGYKMWVSVLDSDTYASFRKRTPETQKLWLFAIQQFLRECSLYNVYPFSGSHDFEATAHSFLESSRRKLVAFFKEHGFFEHLKVARVERTCHFTPHNFKVEVVAHLRPIEDPTFATWLTRLPEPAFVQQRDGTLARQVHAHIEVFYSVTKTGATLGYRVFCHTPLPLIGGKLASRAKMADYVFKNFWRPLIDKHPIPRVPATRAF